MGEVVSLEDTLNLALQGDVPSIMHIALYFDQWDAEDLARPWWQRAANAGDPTAQWRYGTILVNSGEFDEGLRMIVEAAQFSEAAMATAADLMAEMGESALRDEYILKAAEQGARSDWEEDFAAGDELAGMRLIRLDALLSPAISYTEAVMTLGEAWVSPDEFMLHRTAIALRACTPAPWGQGERSEEVAYLALTLARELELHGQSLEDFQTRVVESTSVAFSRSEAKRVAQVFSEESA